MKTLFIIMSLLISVDTWALRCDNTIITEGSSYIQVVENCEIFKEYVVNNQNADIRMVYVKRGSAVYTIKLIDGRVFEINMSRF